METLKKVALTILWGMFATGLLGCMGAGAANTTVRIDIDTRFSEFYNLIGGERALGKALGPVFQQGVKFMQYTENALLTYDESLPAGERFNFEPLGVSFLISDPPLPAPANQPGVRYLNGHVVFADFVPLFDQLGGLRFVGNPLTEVRLNTEKSRYEQYFEKMGFYQKVGETQVYLLPYGLIACQGLQSKMGCSVVNTDAIINTEYLPQPFLPIVERLKPEFTGAPLSQPYRAADGMLEQVYENVVLAVDPNNLRTISLRPLPTLVGIQTGLFVLPASDPLMAFVTLDSANNLGHNIPRPFLEYIAAHGGNELAGQPIGELFEQNGIRRQCFTNYCLDYDPAAPAGAQIRPAPLGHTYLGLQNYLPAQMRLMVWENKSIIAPGEEQVLGVKVYNDTPGQPMKDIQPTIEITLPNKTVKTMVFPPTSSAGNTYLGVNLPGTKVGDAVTYKVCASQPGGAPVCVTESWLVR